MKQVKRRRILASSIAAVAASKLQAFEGHTTPASAVEPFTVRSGEGRRGGLWFVHGEKAFSTKVSGTDVGKKYAAIEVHAPPGRGPELHMHPGQNEFFYILRGEIGVQCGSERTVCEPVMHVWLLLMCRMHT